MNEIITEFKNYINDNHKEQVYQDFIERNTNFLPHEFIQNHGIHLDVAVRKLKFGNDFISDFVYLAKSSADWNIVLVEIEKPQSKYFKKDSTEFHSDFRKGLDQINRWKAWFQEIDNLKYFTNTTLSLLVGSYRAWQNPFFPKYVLVTGRRSEYEQDKEKKSLIRSLETDDFKIISYDSLLESVQTKRAVYMAILKNEAIEIISEDYSTDFIFSHIPLNRIRFSEKFKKSIQRNKDRWWTRSVENTERFIVEDALEECKTL